jgi:hypothetical protein
METEKTAVCIETSHLLIQVLRGANPAFYNGFFSQDSFR